MFFHECVDRCCSKFDIALKFVLGNGVLIYLRAEDKVAEALETIRLAVAIKHLVESKIRFLKAKISIHSETLSAGYNAGRGLQKIDGPRFDLISKMDRIAERGRYSRIVLSESAFSCIKGYIELTNFNRVIDGSLRGEKGLLRFLEVCDMTDFLSKINALYRRYRPRDASRSDADFRLTIASYDVLREEIRKHASSRDVDQGRVSTVVVHFLEQLGFKISRIDRSRYGSDYVMRYAKGHMFLDIMPEKIRFDEIERHMSLKFQDTNRKLIVFMGGDSEISRRESRELFQELKSNNLYLTLMSVNALITMHNMIFVSGFKERRAILSLLFSRTKHLLKTKEIEELQYRLMRMYMLRKIRRLRGNAYLEDKLFLMISKVRNAAKDAASWQEIGEIIKLIETLSYQVLRIVNSPTTEYRRTNDIVDASYQLGAEKLEQLLLTVRFSKLLPSDFPAYGMTRDGFWEHSVLAGLFVQKMARDLRIRLRYFDEDLQQKRVEEDFYSIGLLHDFGKVIFDQIFTTFYREVIAKEGHGCLISHTREKSYPFDHVRVGAWAIKEADFPIQYARLVHYHHSPRDAEDDIRKLCCILFLAEFFLDPTDQAEPGREFSRNPEELDEALWAAEQLGIDLGQAAAVVDVLREEVNAETDRL